MLMLPVAISNPGANLPLQIRNSNRSARHLSLVANNAFGGHCQIL